MDEVEPEVIMAGLAGTSDEKGKWFEWQFLGKEHTIKMELAYEEEQPNMIIINVTTDDVLKEKLEAMNLFQCLFKELELGQ